MGIDIEVQVTSYPGFGHQLLIGLLALTEMTELEQATFSVRPRPFTVKGVNDESI